MENLEAFAKLVQALAPWRVQLVFIGGWAHYLHSVDPRAKRPAGYQPIFTLDTDLAFGNKTLIEGDMKGALSAHGFKEELAGEHKPPYAHYTLGNASGGFYAEFLTPLTGSGSKRSGKADATMAMAGISAQKLRYLDILLFQPWVLTLNSDTGVNLETPIDIQVANPLCFMVQKFLIHQYRRHNDKKAQDLLYIYKTIMLFSDLIPQFNECWTTHIEPELENKLSSKVLITSKTIFSSVNDVTRQAVLSAQDPTLTPEKLQLTCQLAFEQIFAPKGK